MIKKDLAHDKTSKPADGQSSTKAADGWRETIESILMAIVLALLFRGFVAEAFVIPTGSMAPTLFGRHKDVECPQCANNFWYQATASGEVDESGRRTGTEIASVTCPNCSFSQELDPLENPNDASFSGDRIIVSKFIYDFQQPKRWDVIVFKFPGDATKNYIKRLVGLPNESIRIVGGNVYARPAGTDESQGLIARKPPEKLETLLQLVHDTAHEPQTLIDIGWPSRWSEIAAEDSSAPVWKTPDGGRTFETAGGQGKVAWLNYRNLVPSYDDWRSIVLENKLPSAVAKRPGQLITDVYAYNSSTPARPREFSSSGDSQLGYPPWPENEGLHWVDDLAMQVDADVQSSDGALVLCLVRGGEQFQCRIDLATGEAVLTRIASDGAPDEFASDDGSAFPESVKAQTDVRGPGKYTLRLSNCDHEVLLWVNGQTVAFDGPTTYDTEYVVAPVWSEDDAGDLQPARIGSEGAEVKLSKLQIYRDKYYIATSRGLQYDDINDYIRDQGPEQILSVLSDPTTWQTSDLLDPQNRRFVEFQMEDDQFFPLGDNSPHSLDARLWGAPPYVHRDLLIGKALFIYWPHTWNRPVLFWPNFSRMGPIR